MTARRILWTLYWALVLVFAALASLTAALPFTGTLASVVGIVAAGGVCLVGIAWAPGLGGGRS